MATIQSKVDDLDPTQPAAGICYLSLQDHVVALDLSQDHYDELTKLLQPYFDAGRTEDLAKGGKRIPAYLVATTDVFSFTPKPGAKPATPTEAEPLPADVRSWAQANGIPVPDRGRVGEDITAKFKAAKAAEAAAAAEAEKPDDAKK